MVCGVGVAVAPGTVVQVGSGVRVGPGVFSAGEHKGVVSVLALLPLALDAVTVTEEVLPTLLWTSTVRLRLSWLTT